MTSAAGIVILIPAAGASRRMAGQDKCLEVVGGEAILRRTARIAAATGARVVVTLPDGGPMLPARQRCLIGLTVTTVLVKDAHEGMAASLRAGVHAAAGAQALMVLLPDMPDIGAAEVARMLAVFARDETRPVRGATADGTSGHPVIFPRRLFAEIAVLTGDEGARRVLSGEKVALCPLPGRAALDDLDTPQDWADWRKARS